MKLILLASCACALVVPPLAQRRRDLPVAKGFYDEDDEHDEAPSPWEVGGVRLERLVSFVDDLEDPFGGSWTVDAALDACDELVDALAVEE